MSVFISYSSKDVVFVGRLAAELIKKRIKVWLDKFEMQAGDSLIDKIQDGLDNADFLVVVLSKNSVESQWCKKELNSILMEEIEEKQTRIIPILIDDCKVPVFLREKLYVDFRKDFDAGIGELLRPLSVLLKDKVGRRSVNDTIVDYAVNWAIIDGNYTLNIDFVVWIERQKKSVILQVIVVGDRNATERYRTHVSKDMNWLMKESLILMLCETQALRELNLIVSSEQVYHFNGEVADPKEQLKFDITIRGVLLGIDNGNDIVLNFLDFIEILEDSRDDRMFEVKWKR